MLNRWIFLALFLQLSLTNVATAAEGMYLLHQLPGERLKSSGLKIPPGTLQQLSKAVIQVARGGTGSFVSDQGLLVTNHHVAYRCIARLGARKQHLGLLKKGYLAQSLAQELACPGYDLLVVKEVQDVTPKILKGISDKLHWAKRFEAIRIKKEKLVKSCESGGKQICEVGVLDGGRGYLLSIYQRIRDVRLVYAPPRDLGKFGGDVDNWIYPRHTADFTFLRAYVDAKGHGVAYSKDNIPLKTPTHLKVSRHGVKQAGLALVIGFPGRTARHVTSHAARFHQRVRIPQAISLLGDLATVLQGLMKEDADLHRKYVGLDAGVQNALKYYKMSRKGMQRWQVLRSKEQQEKELRAALDPKEAKAFQAMMKRMAGIYQRQQASYPKLRMLARLLRICAPARNAYHAVKWAREKTKPELQRKEQTYKDKNIYRLEEGAARLDKEIDIRAERVLLTHLLKRAQKLPRKQRLKSLHWLLRWYRRQLKQPRWKVKMVETLFKQRYGAKMSSDRLTNAVTMLYGETQLVAKKSDAAELKRAAELRARHLKMNRRQLARQKDPLLLFATQLERELTALEEGPLKEVEQLLATVLRPQWIARFKRPSYHDANFTVRLSYGSVRNYTNSENKKEHRYLTSLSELIAKDKGTYPFKVPAKLKQAFPSRMKSRWFDRRIGDIPVNFTTTLDTTGGNSGSPVLDDHGRLVGLLFDGTPESILSDWQYLPKRQRSICLDIRFALYLAQIEGATRVLKELGIR